MPLRVILMGMPADNPNVAKTMSSFAKSYGPAKGKAIFYSTINKQRHDKPGDSFLHALGKQTALGAASGGKGHAKAKANPWRAGNALPSVKTRHPTKFKHP